MIFFQLLSGNTDLNHLPPKKQNKNKALLFILSTLKLFMKMQKDRVSRALLVPLVRYQMLFPIMSFWRTWN